MVKGVHFLDEEEQDHRNQRGATFTDDHTVSVAGSDGESTVTFDHVIIAAGATTRLLPGTSR